MKKVLAILIAAICVTALFASQFIDGNISVSRNSSSLTNFVSYIFVTNSITASGPVTNLAGTYITGSLNVGGGVISTKGFQAPGVANINSGEDFVAATNVTAQHGQFRGNGGGVSNVTAWAVLSGMTLTNPYVNGSISTANGNWTINQDGSADFAGNAQGLQIDNQGNLTTPSLNGVPPSSFLTNGDTRGIGGGAQYATNYSGTTTGSGAIARSNAPSIFGLTLLGTPVATSIAAGTPAGSSFLTTNASGQIVMGTPSGSGAGFPLSSDGNAAGHSIVAQGYSIADTNNSGYSFNSNAAIFNGTITANGLASGTPVGGLYVGTNSSGLLVLGTPAGTGGSGGIPTTNGAGTNTYLFAPVLGSDMNAKGFNITNIDYLELKAANATNIGIQIIGETFVGSSVPATFGGSVYIVPAVGGFQPYQESYDTVLGGLNNDCGSFKSYDAVIGGINNVIGDNTTASVYGSFIGGGASNYVNSTLSDAFGELVYATHNNSFTFNGTASTVNDVTNGSALFNVPNGLFVNSTSAAPGYAFTVAGSLQVLSNNVQTIAALSNGTLNVSSTINVTNENISGTLNVGTVYITTGVITNISFATNVWGGTTLALGGIEYIFNTNGAAGITGLTGTQAAQAVPGILQIYPSANITFTNPAGWAESDNQLSRTLTNGNAVTIMVEAIPGHSTNLDIVQRSFH